MDLQEKIRKFFGNVFVKKQDHRGWIIGAVVLLVIFSGLLFCSTQPKFWSVNPPSEKIFKLPITVVYNESSEEQKTKMEQFLGNLNDPSTALKNTELQTKWLDSNSPEATALLAQSKVYYLPQVFFDKSVEEHPQFQNLKGYINQKGNIYFMRLAPLEHLQVPDPTKGHAVGVDLAKAKVVIQEYESYFCDHCATAQETLKKILKEYPSTVSVVYKHFESEDIYNQLAQGAECAADQNKFIQMQDAIFKGQAAMLAKMETVSGMEEATAYIIKLLQGYAKSVGLNLKTFQTCLDQKTHEKDINAQTLDAIDFGINGPPAFFINKKFSAGLLSYDEFKTIIEAELKK